MRGVEDTMSGITRGTEDQKTPKVLFTGADEDRVRRVLAEITDTEVPVGFESDLAAETELDGAEDGADCVVAVASGEQRREGSPLETVLSTDVDIPVVIVSDGSSVTPDEAADAGADDYVQLPLGDSKPFVRRRLRAYAEGNRPEPRSVQGYGTVFDNVQSPVFLVDVQKKDDGVEFVLERVNPAYEENVGFSSEELEGRTPTEVLGEEVGREVRDNYLECYREQEEISYEEEIEVPVGTRMYHTALSPVIVDGEVEGIVGNARDITDLRERENELREKRTQLRGILDTVSATVFMKDTDGRYLLMNREGKELLGIEGDVSGMTDYDIFSEEVADRYVDDDSRVFEEEETVEFEEDVPTEDGMRTHLTLKTPIYDEDDELYGLCAVSTDITERKEREREIKRKNDLLAQTEEIANTGGWEVDVVTGEQRWTEGTYDIHDLPTSYDMTVDEGIDFYHPEDRDTIREVVERCREEGEPYDVELRLVTAEDRLRWVRTRGEPVTEDGELSKLRGAIQDITERKERERELRERSEAMEASMDGMAILDENREYSYVNQAHADIYGYDDPDALLGESWRTLYDEDEIERLEEDTMQVLAEDGEWRGEATGVRKDGSEFEQELSLTVLEDGSTICVVRDVTERKERERELRRYEAFIENSSDLVTLLGKDGTILFQSSSIEDRLGYSQGETVGDSAFEYVHPDDRGRVVEEFTSLTNEQTNYTEDVEFRFRHSDGSYVWLEAVGVDRTDEGVGGIIVNSRDVTERRKRERRLKEQKEQMEFFNSLLRHDLLNSMTVIRGNADLLLGEVDENDDRRERVEKIHEKSEDIVDLTKRVRQVLNRLTEEGTAELSSYDLSRVAEERLESFEDAYPWAEYTANLPESAPVLADAFLGDVIENLLVNAVEHNDSDEPQVKIDMERGQDTATLRVADNGPGIPDDEKEKVLHKGERGASSSGLGFGLYFVNSMMSEYGGDVRIEDNEPEGTVVSIEIPNANGGQDD